MDGVFSSKESVRIAPSLSLQEGGKSVQGTLRASAPMVLGFSSRKTQERMPALAHRLASCAFLLLVEFLSLFWRRGIWLTPIVPAPRPASAFYLRTARIEN